MPEGSGVRVDRVLRAIAIVAALYFAQSLILPIALAVVIGVAMSPVVRRLHRWGLPRGLAVVACVMVGLGSLGCVAWLVGGQIAQLARRAGEFREPILAKTQSLGPVGGFMRDSFQVFQESLDRASGAAKPKPEDAPIDPGAPKEKKSREEKGSLTAVWNLAKSLFGTAGQAILIVILLILFLLHQEDLGKRLLRTLRDRGMNVSESTLDESGRKVSTYLLTEAGVNSIYGVLITLGTWVLHVPQPLFWGLLAGLFRFIPYIGTWMVAALALVLSIALSPTWTQPGLLLGYWLLLEILTADLVEPWIYGKRTGMTAVGVMVSALFWSWLWGIAGLMVATPITACLAELGGEIPGLRWLNTLFSATPSEPEPSLPATPPIPVDRKA